MWIRPWHVMAGVSSLAVLLIGLAYFAGDPGKEILLGIGLNLVSSVFLFVLVERYLARVKLVNGKEVNGFDYFKFARNIDRSKDIRVLATFIYPLTDRPDYAEERKALTAALMNALQRHSFLGVRLLFLHPGSMAAQMRVAERKNEDIIGRMNETLATLRDLLARLAASPGRHKIEVRLSSRMPPFSLFQTDNFASISFYYRDRPLSEVVRYEFFTDTPLGVFVEKTFDDFWRDDKAVTLEDYFRDLSSGRSVP